MGVEIKMPIIVKNFQTERKKGRKVKEELKKYKCKGKIVRKCVEKKSPVYLC